MSRSSNQPPTPDGVGQTSQARKLHESVAPQSLGHGDVNVVFARESERQRDVRSGSATGSRQGVSGAGSGHELGDGPRDHADASRFGQEQSQDMVEQTRLRAYEIYEERLRKGTHGCCNSDWAQAENDESHSSKHAVTGRSSERVESAYANMRANQPRSQD